MTSYQDITRQIGDQWVAALKRAEESFGAVVQNVQDARAKVEVPQIPVPEQVAKLNEAISERMPKPGEVLKANFELTERLLAAQKDFALKVIAAATGEESGAEPEAAAPAPAKKSSK